MKFGSNQKIALGAMAAPFVIATTALFMDKSTFSEWAGFCQILIPTVIGIVLTNSAIVKGTSAFAAKKQADQ